MINVSNIKKAEELKSGKVKRSTSGESFSSYLSPKVSFQSSAVGGASSISVTNAIFSTQMIGSEEEREIKKNLLKRSSVLIDKLEEIRDGLLLGHISKEKLIEISRFVKERRFNSNDANLMSIIEEIELRVEVELAKLMK